MSGSPNRTTTLPPASPVRVVTLCAAIFILTTSVHAQQTTAIITVPSVPGRVIVEGASSPRRSWSFRNSYAGVSELGARIEDFKLVDDNGREVSVRKIAPGQFEGAAAAARFRYKINLTPPARASDSALVSWVGEERGLLMLADLLPVSQAPDQETTRTNDKSKAAAPESAQILFNLLPNWGAFSNEEQNGLGVFQVRDVARAVFLLGSGLRVSRTNISGMWLNFVAGGDWAFSDREALSMAIDVLKAHHEVFASMPAVQGTLILIPFPQTVTASKWSAETRGATVTLLMGRLPSKTGGLAQLSVPLTHELFHLWAPNGLALEGNYDWFYEGFTIYQAARTAVDLGLLTFPEFLSSIGRAYDAYAAGTDRDRWSLVQASEVRWTGGESVVYQKSMLVALLYDLKLRSQSNGKRSLNDVYRELFHHNRSLPVRAGDSSIRAPGNGNEAVLKVLASAAGMQTFADAYINRPVQIDLQSELAAFGLRVEQSGSRTQVSVSETLTRRQRDLLHDLGYNDAARSGTKRK